MARPFNILACLLLLSLGTIAKEPPAASSKKAAKGVNRNEVLSLYMEGEFETLVALLENIRRERQLRDREDSIFIYKFLGVIYGADERTKRKAEAFLYQMLQLDPNEDLSALGVGESVQRIFERVRTRVGPGADSTARGGKPALAAIPAPAAPGPGAPATEPAASAPAPTAQGPSREKKVPNWVWYATGGAAAAVLAGVVILSQDPDPKVNAISDTLQ